MNNISLIDTEIWWNMLPLTYTRSVADLRLGMFSIKEKWEKYTKAQITIHTRPHLQLQYAISEKPKLQINSAILPNEDLIHEIIQLRDGESLYSNTLWLASKNNVPTSKEKRKELSEDIHLSILRHPEDLFLLAGQEIKKDLALIKREKKSKSLPNTNKVIGNHEIFIDTGAQIEHTILNTTFGPIYIGENATVMEGSLLRGPFSLGDNSEAKMGTRVYPNTSIGPFCKIGGEIKNSVILGNSNKGHEGYMGNSVIGEWCNWGADTNNSNMKNNYKEVSLWDYNSEKFRATGQQFVGLIMGDHSKTGINTMFNTGTVVGVNCNIYGDGYPRKFIPSFSWGGSKGYKTYDINKAIETAKEMQKRRGKLFSSTEESILDYVFSSTSQYRIWNK